jgi:hypothetical protein
VRYWPGCEHPKTESNTIRQPSGTRCRTCHYTSDIERRKERQARERGDLAVRWLAFSIVRGMFERLYPGRAA